MKNYKEHVNKFFKEQKKKLWVAALGVFVLAFIVGCANNPSEFSSVSPTLEVNASETVYPDTAENEGGHPATTPLPTVNHDNSTPTPTPEPTKTPGIPFECENVAEYTRAKLWPWATMTDEQISRLPDLEVQFFRDRKREEEYKEFDQENGSRGDPFRFLPPGSVALGYRAVNPPYSSWGGLNVEKFRGDDPSKSEGAFWGAGWDGFADSFEGKTAYCIVASGLDFQFRGGGPSDTRNYKGALTKPKFIYIGRPDEIK